MINLISDKELPVLWDEIKAHLRLDSEDEKDLLMDYAESAQEYAEQITGRAFGKRTLEWKGYARGSYVFLPYPPLIEVVSITCAGESLSYTIDTKDPAVLILDDEPSGEVKVEYKSGEPVSRIGKLSVLEMTANFDLFRSTVVDGKPRQVPLTVEKLLRPLREWSDMK